MAMTLAQKVDKITKGLQIEKDGALPRILSTACEVLGLEQEGSLQEKADRALALLMKVEKLKAECGLESNLALMDALAQLCDALDVPNQGQVMHIVTQCLEKLDGPQELQPDVQKIKIIAEQLELDPSLSTKDLVMEACKALDVEPSGNLVQLADKCVELLGVDLTEEPTTALELVSVPRSPPACAAMFKKPQEPMQDREFAPWPRSVPASASEEWTVHSDVAPGPPLAAVPPPATLGRVSSLTEHIRRGADGLAADDAPGVGMKLLVKLLENIEQALVLIRSFECRRHVVVLGETGAGKSTLIQFLAGKTLRPFEHQGAIVYDAVDPLPGFKIGHCHTSETLSIRPYQRPNGAVFVDSAGYEDTQGPEIDIATSVSFQKLAACSAGLRLVVVINTNTLRVGRGKDPKAVVDLVSQVVEDFDQYKMAFTFLFTRTEDVPEMRGQSLDAVRQVLRTQLASVAASTKGKGQRIFKWMLRCLENGWPYVEVFHPELSKRDELIKKLERFRDPEAVIGAQDVPAEKIIKCGLTQKMKSHISVHLEKALDGMKEALENDDVVSLNELHSTAQFLERTIDEDSVRQKVEKMEKLLEKDIATRTLATEVLIKNGTSVDDGEFACSDALKVLASMDFLDQLPGANVSFLSQFLDKQLQCLVDGLVETDEVSGDGLQRLGLLALWSEAERSARNRMGPIAERKDEAIAKLETAMRLRTGLLRGYIQRRAFDHLLPLLPGLERLSLRASAWHGLGVEAAADVTPCLTSAVCCVAAEVQLAHGRSLDLLADLELKTESLSTKAAFDERWEAFDKSQELVEPLLKKIEQQQGPAKLLELVVQTRAKISTGLDKVLEVILQDARKVLATLLRQQADVVGATRAAGALLGFKVSAASQIVNYQQKTASRDSLALFETLCSQLFASVKAVATSLQALCARLPEAGAGNADQLLLAFETLQACTWLDVHLEALQIEVFVQKTLEVSQASFRKYQKEVLALAMGALKGFLESPLEGTAHFESLQRHVLEIQALKGLSALFKDFEGMTDPLRLELQQYVEIMGSKNRLFQEHPAGSTSHMAQLQGFLQLAEECEATLHVHQKMSSMVHLSEGQAFCSMLQPLVDNVNKQLASCRDVIADVFGNGSGMCCLEKSQLAVAVAILQALEQWRQKSLSNILAALPTKEKLCQEVEGKVRKRAAELREQIQSASGPAALDKVADDLVWLQDLEVLDRFIMRSASAEHQALSHMLQLQRSAVDDSFKRQVLRFDFGGLGQRIEELQASRLPGSQQSFQALLDLVSQSVADKIKDANSCVATAAAVAGCIKALKVAEQQVGKVLKEHTSINIPEVVTGISSRVQEHFLKLVSELDSAIAAKNFRRIAELVASAEEYHQGAAALLSGASGKKLENCNKEVQKVFKMPQESVETFFRRLAGQEEGDSSDLIGILDNLKQGAFREPRMPSLESMYSAAVQHMRDTLTKNSREMQSKVQGRCTITELERQIEYYQALKTEFDRGLKEHLADVDFNPGDRLKTLQKREQDAKDHFQEKLQDHKFVDEEVLDDLEKLLLKGWPEKRWWGLGSMVGSPVYSWEESSYQRQYKARCTSVQDQLLQMLRGARTNLNSHRYDLVTPSLKAVLHSLEKLKKHIETDAVSDEWKHLKTEIRRHFEGMQGELAATLARGSIDEFGKVFKRYKLWCNHLGDRAICELRLDPAHTVSKLKQMVTTYEESRRDLKLDVLKKMVPMLRQVGWILHSEALLTFQHHPLPSLEDLMASHFSMEYSFKLVAQKLGQFNLDHTATHADIKSAFERLSKACRPKADGSGGRRDEYMRLCNIRDDLLKVAEGSLTRQLQGLFADHIQEIPQDISRRIAEHLANGDFGKLKPLVEAVDSLQVISGLVDPPLPHEQAASAAHKLIRDHAKKLEAEALTLWETQNDDVNALRRIQSIFSMLKTINDTFSAWVDIYSMEALVLLRQRVDARIDHLFQVARQSLPEDEEECWMKMEGFAMNLVLVGAIVNELPVCKEYAKSKINLLLNAATEKLWGYTYLFKLGMLLEQGKVGRLTREGTVRPEDEMVAKALVHEFKHFRDVLTVVWNTQTGATQRDVASTVKGVVGKTVTMSNGSKAEHRPEMVDSERLLKGYQAYEEEFNANFQKWHIGELTPEKLVLEVQKQCNALQPCRVGNWSDALREQLPQLLGRIFAYFTISKSGESFKRLEAAAAEGDAERVGNPASLDTVLQKAHNVQIITVLRLFGYDTPGQGKLRNHLMQIRTGEGKSMILGACSLLFGLLGFRVRCVCYSDYLSKRDYGLFQGLFRAFGVESLVTYSKITDYSEDAVARRGDIRELTMQLLEGKLSPRPAPAAVQEEILLVDEVDVFFGPEFQGNTHNVIAQMPLEEVRAILLKIWENRADASNPRKLFQTVQASQEYKALQSRFGAWQQLLGAEVQAMCSDLQHFEEPKCHYDPRSDRVYYIIMDSPCYDVVYGYRTAFAFLKHSPKNVDESLRKALQLRISCGQFSYANVNPTCMLGVSGTLEALGEYEWGVMAKYGFSSYSLVPSVYGASNFRFLDQTGGKPITIEKTLDDFYQAITNDVKAKLIQKRAAIVFFQDPAALEKYLETSYAKQIPAKNLLLECQSHAEKETAIKRAASTGQATFTTAIFGRGTDFVCTDERLSKVGGVHVIQTFVAADASEEKQIQGRTARQGKEGSYSLILLQKELQDLGVDAARAAAMAPQDLHELVQSKIQQKCLAASKEREKKLAVATERDRLSHQYLDALLAGNAAAAAPKLQEIYKQIRASTRSLKVSKARIIILSDATGSMCSLWGSTRAQVREMLSRVHELAGDSLELLWVAYRDYSDSKCLEQSPWTSQPLVLQQFVDRIICDGGGDAEEAVEKALLFARQQHSTANPVTRILLMGDAPPHFETKGQKLTHHACHLETDYKVESQALKSLGVPVFTFRIGGCSKTQEDFKYIANATGGQFADLTPDKLIDAVCISALEEIGGAELVAEYMARYNVQ